MRCSRVEPRAVAHCSRAIGIFLITTSAEIEANLSPDKLTKSLLVAFEELFEKIGALWLDKLIPPEDYMDIDVFEDAEKTKEDNKIMKYLISEKTGQTVRVKMVRRRMIER